MTFALTALLIIAIASQSSAQPLPQAAAASFSKLNVKPASLNFKKIDLSKKRQ